MFQRILMVCTGNICRSPMAEVLFAARASARGQEGVRVESAGISALVGRPADPIAVELMAERGLDLSPHRARQLTEEMMREFELILVMETGQQRILEQRFPTAHGKVQRLGRFGDFDVPDPFRRPRADFEQALAMIERGVSDFEAHGA